MNENEEISITATSALFDACVTNDSIITTINRIEYIHEEKIKNEKSVLFFAYAILCFKFQQLLQDTSIVTG